MCCVILQNLNSTFILVVSSHDFIKAHEVYMYTKLHTVVLDALLQASRCSREIFALVLFDLGTCGTLATYVTSF